MTVLENLELGAYSRSDKQGIKEDLEQNFPIFSCPRRTTEAAWR